MEHLKLYIGGHWVEGHSGAFISVEDPAAGRIIGRVPDGDAEDVERAVIAAKEALPGWKASTAQERARLLERVAEYFEAHMDELADLVTGELGAPVNMVKDWHCRPAVGEARYYAEIARNYQYEVSVPGARILREPVGIVAGMTPWNFPVDQITVKIFPALAAGNCVVLKPSQYTPMTALFIARAIHWAGFPDGVFNVVTGRGGQVGNVLAAHPEIRMVSFTGSTDAGKAVGKLALDTVKKLTLELGGKSAAVLLPGGDADLAVSTVLDDCFLNSGQTCSALTRLLVPDTMLDMVEAMVTEKASAYTVGCPMDFSTMVGPVIHKSAYDKIRNYVKIGVEEGAKMIVGSVPAAHRHGGYFIQPVVFSAVKNFMTIAREEIFGPVLCILPYHTEDEAAAIVNDSPYGLCGGVFGETEHAVAFARRMETGGVRINGAALTLGAPFGGYKQSGLGREYSLHQFEDFLEIKSLLME